MTDIEERLRTELAELADWFTDEPMAGAETSTPENRSHRSRWPLVAAACAALIAGAVGASVLVDGSGRDVSSIASTDTPVGGSAQPTGTAGTGPTLVLEGETVLSESPLTVAGARAPALAVAPDAWGEQVVIEPMDSIDAALEQHQRDVTDQVQRPQGDLELIKTTLVGRIAGQPWVIQVLEGPAPGPGSAPGSVLRVRSVSSPDAGFSAAGETVFGESLEWIAPLPVASAPRPVDVGYSTPEGWLTWDLLPAETAAVTFRDNDDRLWTQPVAGFAALPVALDPGERFTVEALDRRGNALWTITQTAEGPPPLPQLVGQDLDAVLGPGLDARELSATSANGYTIIVVGASWCLPCFERIDEIQRALQQAASNGAAIVSIDASGDPDAFWPDPAGWPFERLRAPDGRLITNVGAVPIFLLVDADLKVIDATLGVDELKAIANKAQN